MKYKTFKWIFISLYIAIVIYIIYISRSIIKPIFLSFIIAYVLNPFVKLLTRRGVKERTSVRICLAVLGLMVLFTALYIVPGLIRDFLGIVSNINVYSNTFSDFIKGDTYNNLPPYLKNIIDVTMARFEGGAKHYLNDILNKTMNFSSELPNYILTPIFIYYFLADSSYFINLIKLMIPSSVRSRTVKLLGEIDMAIGSYIRGQILLSIIVAILTFVVLFTFKIKFPVVIAIINGITNIIPYFGPIIGYIPAFISALTESPKMALIVVGALFVIQEIESMVIAPKILGDSMGLHPVFVVAILLIGGKYFGGWGLLLSVPAAGIIKLTYKYAVKNLF